MLWEARLKFRAPVKAGPHVVTVAFVQESQAAHPGRLQRYIRSSVDNFDWSGQPHIQMLSITGPFDSTGSGDTPSRRRIFICRPSGAANETACARQIISTLARRAYRRPLTAVDEQRIFGFYETARRERGFEAGIEAAVQRILASPQFILRIERDPAQGVIHAVTDVELASRLSFFLWSSIPDDALVKLALEGSLKRPAVLDREVRRMLADPKSAAIVENFAGQWLRLRNVRNILPNSDLYPDFDENLRQSFRRETEMFFESVAVREDRNVLDLLTADYSFINERLARHYGIAGIYGSHFQHARSTILSGEAFWGREVFLRRHRTRKERRRSCAVNGFWKIFWGRRFPRRRRMCLP